MTVSTTEPRITYAGNGSTTTFAIPFSFLDSTEVVVNLITDSTNDVVLQTDPTEYSVSGTDVEMVTAPASGETLVITLGVAESQSTDYLANDAFPAEDHEAALDKVTRLVKQIKYELDYNTLRLPVNLLTSTTVTDTDIAASKIFRINSSGDGVELATVNSITNGGDSWGDPIDVSITVDTDSAYNVGTNTERLASVYADTLYGTLAEAAQTNITSLGTLTTLTIDNITINGNDISSSSGDITFSPTGIVDFSGSTDHIAIPVGTTGQRDTSDGAGSLRWNSTDGKLEAYTGSAWVQYTSAGGPGAWSDPIDANITVDTDSTYDLGTAGARLLNMYADNLYGSIAEAAQTNITSLGTLTTLSVDNLTLNGNDISSSSGDITITPTGIVDMTASTDHFLPPTGTTGQRTGSTAGELRYNSTDNVLEYYNGSGWVQISSSSGGMTLLSTQTASASATVDFDNVFDSTYEVYMVTFSNVISATDGVSFNMRVGTGAGPTYQSGAADYAWTVGYMAASLSGSVDASDSEMTITSNLDLGNAANEAISGTIYIHSPADTGLHTYFDGTASGMRSTGQLIKYMIASKYLSTTAVTSLRFLTSSGNITSGEFKLYGLQKTV